MSVRRRFDGAWEQINGCGYPRGVIPTLRRETEPGGPARRSLKRERWRPAGQ